ncbi:hypothetical protein [Yoonia sp. R2-816]|uniref:hypothetical protein n=1 Tax=Yoonia sp. R2-816 TaxID=3342638 RepID=UPI00372D735E
MTVDELHGALDTSDQDPGCAKSPDKTASGWEITAAADKQSDAISSRLREWGTRPAQGGPDYIFKVAKRL